MADPKSRSRVERLLRGEIRPDDLANLFLYVRDRSDGREIVQEIGDFVAHQNVRTKGPVTRMASDWFLQILFYTYHIYNEGNSRYSKHLPWFMPEFLTSSFRLLDPNTIRKETGIAKQRAKKLLPEVIGKLVENPDGTYAVGANYGLDEGKLLDCLCRHVTILPGISGERFFQDFCDTLKSNALLHKSELSAFASLSAPVQLFAIASMHNCVIKFRNAPQIILLANTGPRGELGVVAPMLVKEPPDAKIVHGTIFKSDLDKEKYCSAQLIEERNWAKVQIELAPSGLLDILK